MDRHGSVLPTPKATTSEALDWNSQGWMWRGRQRETDATIVSSHPPLKEHNLRLPISRIVRSHILLIPKSNILGVVFNRLTVLLGANYASPSRVAQMTIIPTCLMFCSTTHTSSVEILGFMKYFSGLTISNTSMLRTSYMAYSSS